MSAEILREAAALMRSRAEAATPGDPGRGGYEAYVLGSEGYAVMGAPRKFARTFVARCGMNDWETDRRNAEHLSSWHPAVALAVADWLDSERIACTDSFDDFVPEVLTPAAPAVATAYLGRADQ